ncbi:hypothetical protein Enr10x_21230 [Gimesia panareensis]|uniref:Uncharacterized protein n=1 Tax=Gimesia panareensis TaxID=2527978 RepID=A0A517Q599_9PLAN|nr:hypothetical protein [Gimesia panareensis]QDT26813.1 hypothetical protein Enr10x_21230 [Gimesia panareensis]
MTTIFPDPNDSKHTDLVALLFWIFAMIVLALTLPGCQQDKQTYQPFIAPEVPAERPVDKIRPAAHNAAERVDDILEETPVPAVATELTDDVLDGIEMINPLPPPTAPDPKVAEIIEPDFEPVVSLPDISEPTTDDVTEDSTMGMSSWIVVVVGLSALVYFAFKMFKGSDQDDKDLKHETTTI